MNKDKKLDTLFSTFIRKRAIQRVGGCERVETYQTTYKQLNCAHMFSSRHHSVRWDEDNAAGLCAGCHRYLDDNAYEKVEWFTRHLGEEKFDLLRARASLIYKPDREAIEIYLKEVGK